MRRPRSGPFYSGDASSGAARLAQCGAPPLRLSHTSGARGKRGTKIDKPVRHLIHGGLTSVAISFRTRLLVITITWSPRNGPARRNAPGQSSRIYLQRRARHLRHPRVSASRKPRRFRNIAANGRAAFVIDDVQSIDPWRVRCSRSEGDTEPSPDARTDTRRTR